MKYTEIFHPAAPIDERVFLVGRNEELRDINLLLEQIAQHPVIVGARGIGKTSLLKVICREHQHAALAEFNCTSTTSFDDIGKSILSSIGFDVMLSESVQRTGREAKGIWKILAIGEVSGTASNEKETKRLEIGQYKVDEQLLFRILTKLHKPILVTIDEYDLVKDQTTKTQVAEFVKMISDQKAGHAIRLIFAGVAASKDALIGAHESVTRQTPEIFLPLLKPDNFMEYMTTAEKKLGIRIHRAAKEEIANVCKGLPYYMHLLCAESIQAMRQRDEMSSVLNYDDFEKGKERATTKVYRDHLKRYGAALKSIAANEVAFSTLKILCEFDDSEIGFSKLFQYAEKTKFQAISDLSMGLRYLQSNRILSVSQDGKRVWFADPLLKPFLLLRFKQLRSGKGHPQQPTLFDY